MFFGRYDYSIDDKGRLVIPSKYRNEISGNLYLLRGYEGCVSIYREQDFLKLMEKLQSLKYEKEATRKHNRLVLESIVEINVDKMGRMQLPKTTLERYSINKNVSIIGLLDHFEIWDTEKFNEYKEINDKDFEGNAEDLLKDEN